MRLDPCRFRGRLSRFISIGALALLLCGCANGDGISFLHPHGMVADAQRGWLADILLCMSIVVIPVFVLVPFVAWRYRRGNSAAAYRPKWEFSWPLEFAVWGIPVLVVAALAYLVVTRETPLDPYSSIAGKAPPLQIDVVALDWKWLFVYPDQHIATVSTLVIPQDRPVSFHLTSDANMQSFFIPALGSQIYAMAGMVTRLHLIADRPGTLMGENTQYNGEHFQNDRFGVKVLSPTDFDHWVAERQAGGMNFDADVYGKLSARGTTEDAKKALGVNASDTIAFTHVGTGFFASIVDKYNPGAMSMSGQEMQGGMTP